MPLPGSTPKTSPESTSPPSPGGRWGRVDAGHSVPMLFWIQLPPLIGGSVLIIHLYPFIYAACRIALAAFWVAVVALASAQFSRTLPTASLLRLPVGAKHRYHVARVTHPS